jgi:hypothetical protein
MQKFWQRRAGCGTNDVKEPRVKVASAVARAGR